MKILFLQDDFPPQSFGGAGISTYELALKMKQLGHEVFVITTTRKESEMGESYYNGLKIYKIISNYHDRWREYVSLYNRQVIPTLTEILKNIHPDVIHINNVHSHLSYYSLKLAKKYSKAVIFTARDTMLFSYGKLETHAYIYCYDTHFSWWEHLKQARKRWNPFRNFVIKKYLKYVDRIFAISEALKIALKENGIKNVGVIYNGIDVNQWNVSNDEIDNFKKKHNLIGKRVILFGGRLSASKGAEKTILALKEIVSQVPNVILLVIGKVDWYADLMKQKAHDLGIQESLVFTGWIEGQEIKAAYQASEIVLMPSIYLDAFGRVNIEAMAAKKPVVGTCFGGTPEIVKDGETGYIVNPIYPERITDKVLELLNNVDKAEAFGLSGYKRVLVEFNQDHIAEQYIHVYNNEVSKNR